jgi:trans-aconitate methyltransferase
VDALVARGFTDLTVLDLSSAALAASRKRLGVKSDQVEWIAADMTGWAPSRTYDVWHDRAAFHFLTDRADQAAYGARLRSALRQGGHAIIGTFAPDGPEKCSGLPVVRHDAASLQEIFGPEFALVDSRRHNHMTPLGVTQRFQFSTYLRIKMK